MPNETLIELYGYLGSVLVVVSMLMSSVVKLRVINTVGSVISGTYALIIGSFPLALMNICLIVINVYNLLGLLNPKHHHDLVPCAPEDGVMQYFLSHYAQDIRLYFPEFSQADPDLDAVYMVFCNGEPGGILLAKQTAEGVLESHLEYSTPTYRDCSIGKFLYSALPGQGVRTVVVPQASQKHKPYLEKMGYTLQDNSYIKNLQ